MPTSFNALYVWDGPEFRNHRPLFGIFFKKIQIRFQLVFVFEYLLCSQTQLNIYIIIQLLNSQFLANILVTCHNVPVPGWNPSDAIILASHRFRSVPATLWHGYTVVRNYAEVIVTFAVLNNNNDKLCPILLRAKLTVPSIYGVLSNCPCKIIGHKFAWNHIQSFCDLELGPTIYWPIRW